MNEHNNKNNSKALNKAVYSVPRVLPSVFFDGIHWSCVHATLKCRSNVDQCHPLAVGRYFQCVWNEPVRSSISIECERIENAIKINAIIFRWLLCVQMRLSVIDLHSAMPLRGFLYRFIVFGYLFYWSFKQTEEKNKCV